MPVGQMQLSPLAPPTAINPIGTALHAMVAAYYQPQQMGAEVALKNAQAQQAQATANFLPYNNLITALSNPMVLSLMAKNPGARDQLLNKLTQMPLNFNNQPNARGGNGTPGWVNGIKNIFGANNNSNQSQQNIQPNVGSGVLMGNASSPGASANAGGATGQDVMSNADATSLANQRAASTGSPQIGASGAIDPTTPAANAYGIDSGTPEGNRMLSQSKPSPAYTLQLQNQASQQNTDYANKNAALQKYMDAANAEGKDSAYIQASAAQAREAYNRAWVKGAAMHIPYLKNLANFDPGTVDAINATNNLVIQRASQLYGGSQSDYRDQMVSNSKPNVGMPKESYNRALDNQEAIAQRFGEHLGFNNHAKALGITDPNVMNGLWLDYQDKKPFYDVNKNAPIKNNEKSYPDFLNKVVKNGQVNQDAINKMPSQTYNKNAITKAQVTEENIQETMRATGKSREYVVGKLKDKGLL